MRLAATLVALVALVACTGAPTLVDRPDEGEDAGAAEPEAEQDPGAADDPHGDLTCGDATLEAVNAAIGGQLAAFAEGDFAAALEFASTGFRDDFDVERFRAVIEEGFPAVAENQGHTSDVCVQVEDRVDVLVTVVGPDEDQELRYGLVREDGQWRIDGAVPVAPSDEPVEV